MQTTTANGKNEKKGSKVGGVTVEKTTETMDAADSNVTETKTETPDSSEDRTNRPSLSKEDQRALFDSVYESLAAFDAAEDAVGAARAKCQAKAKEVFERMGLGRFQRKGQLAIQVVKSAKSPSGFAFRSERKIEATPVD